MTASPSRQAGRFVRLACLLLAFVTSATRLAPVVAVAQEPAPALAQEPAPTWELRVCADPDNLPYSNREEEGFENAILDILAAELGAEVSYAWLPLPRREGQDELMVRMGACDVLASVPDGRAPFLTTLAYFRSIEVFVTRKDAPFEISSLDDPLLQDLRIGVLRGSPADYALVGRGMIDNVSHFFASDPSEEILQRVVDGSLDLGILWGPIAGYEAQRLELPVTLTPVSPQLDMPFQPMFQALSLALRSDDVALGDLLNAAIERRWDDIQQVLEAYGVPLLPLTHPGSPATTAVGYPLRIGVVLPTLTGLDPVFPMGPELVGEPALRGAILAAEQLDVDPQRPIELLIATAPDAAAAERAARRLVAAQDAVVLIGGLGDGQTEVLSAVAEELDLLFLDIGAGPKSPSADQGAEPQPPSPVGNAEPQPPSGDRSSNPSAQTCHASTFTIAADDVMYLQAMASAIVADGVESWFVVHTDSPLGEERYQQLAEALEQEAPAGREAGRIAVPPGQPLYRQAFDAIEESGAQAVALLLEADAQLVFLGQYETAGIEAVVHGFPTEFAQTRQFYTALAQDAHDTGSGPRVALWDASAPDGEELNERFLARWGYPMDPTAWAAYAAVKVAVDSAAAVDSSDPESLKRHLTAAGTAFDLHKGAPLSFGPGDHQLVQPVYVVRLQPDAGSLLEIAEVVDEVQVGGGKVDCPE